MISKYDKRIALMPNGNDYKSVRDLSELRDGNGMEAVKFVDSDGMTCAYRMPTGGCVPIPGDSGQDSIACVGLVITGKGGRNQSACILRDISDTGCPPAIEEALVTRQDVAEGRVFISRGKGG